jgi:hypothetical protein
LTRSGVSVGYRSRTSAAAPDTIAADCEVPVPRKKWSPIRASGVALVDQRARHAQALQVRAGRDEIGPPAARARPGRVVADDVVAAVDRPERVRAADGEHEGVVRRVGEALGVVCALVAAVPGRRHDDDALLPGLLGRIGERVDEVALPRVRAVRKVEDADVQAGVVRVLYDPVDRGDDLGDVGAAVRGGDLEADDPGTGCHSAVATACGGDQPRHERAVPEGVEPRKVRRLRLQREVGSVDDLPGGASSPATGATPESITATSTPRPV